MKKLWFLKNKGVKNLKKKSLEHLEASNYTTKHSLNVAPLHSHSSLDHLKQIKYEEVMSYVSKRILRE